MQLGKKTRKVLALAASGVCGICALRSTALASTITWTSTTDQSWLNPGNWSGGLPGASDLAVFVSGSLPPSNTATISSSTSVGAIVDNITPTTNLTINGAGTLSLFGATVTMPEPSGFGTSSFTRTNTILANTSTLTTSKNLTLGAGLTLALMNSGPNYIIGSQGSGASAGQQITINSNIVDAGAGTHAGLTVLGGGNFSVSGATVNLRGNDTFTGGLTIGTPDGLQGVALSVTAASNLPSTGSILINEQGQLLLSAAGTYGTVGQTIFLNGIGINKNSSGAIRTGGNVADTMVWQGDLSIGTSDVQDQASGFVVISVTSAASKTVQLTGKVTGSGSIQKQGQGTLRYSGTTNDNTGATQIGNGVITVDPGSKMGTGDLIMFQTSNNTTTVNLFNTLQDVGALSSTFTAQNGGSPLTDVQAINLGGGSASNVTLNIHQKSNTAFGYGNDISLTSTLQGPGNVTMDSSSNHTLTLTGPNLYSGDTTINGGTLNVANGANGSATGSGTVTVNSGGHLASGGAIVLAAPVTSGSISGKLVVNSGGQVSPGNDSAIGTLNVASLDAHTGSIFNFDLIGGTSAQADRLTVSNALALDSGTETINVLGSQLAFGNYTLMTFGSLSTASTAFTLGTTPGGSNRNYALTTNSSGVFLNITNTGVERDWSIGGGSPPIDGAGTWAVGGTNWFNTPSTASAPYDNSANTDVIFGNGGTAGNVTLGSAVRTGGVLVFGSTGGGSSYTIGLLGGSNSLTLGKGVNASTSATINAPVVLETLGTFSVGSGASLTLNGGLSETGGSRALLKTDLGTLVLNGTGAYTGGTTISQGVLVATTSGLPAAGGVVNNATLMFRNSAAGTYAGVISGTGSVAINSSNGTAAVVLSASNSYTGATVVQNGVLRTGNINNLGSGDGGIIFNGGTLQTTSTLSFPRNGGGITPARTVTLTPGTTSTIDTNGFDLTFNQNIGGAGNLNKIGAGNLTLTGLPSTTVIGTVAITGGKITLAPPSNIPSFGIAASSTDTNTFTGDLEIADPMELRLFGGNFSGGGHVRVEISGINIVSRGDTTIGNQIVLDNPLPDPHAFSVNLGANAFNSLTLTGGITGNADVLFTNGAGFISVGGVNTYAGNTTIDNGLGGGVFLLADNTLPATTGVHVSSTGILDLNGFQQTIASLDGGSSTAEVINGVGTANLPSVLTIVGAATTHFDGIIIDGNDNTMALRLGTGNTGQLTLNGTNTYTGGTTLNGGTLAVNEDVNFGTPGTPVTFGGGALQTTTQSFDTIGRAITVNPGSSTLGVAAGTTFGLLGSANTVWNGGTLTVAGGGTLLIGRSGGTVSVATGSTLGIGTNSTVRITTTTDQFTDSNNPSRHLSVVNNGALLLPAGNSVITQHSGQGALSITNGATLKIAAGGLTNRSGTLTIDTGNNSRLDLTNNNMIVDFSTLGAVKGYILSGYNSGAWNGPGIISSSALTDTSPRKELGYGQAGLLNLTQFGGQSVDPTSILVKYTFAGDSNLDGKVDVGDLTRLALHWQTASDWTGGDFNYDGFVDIKDFQYMVLNWQQGVGAPLGPNLAAFAAQLGLPDIGASVPEPASASLLLAASGALLARRRRRNR